LKHVGPKEKHLLFLLNVSEVAQNRVEKTLVEQATKEEQGTLQDKIREGKLEENNDILFVVAHSL